MLPHGYSVPEFETRGLVLCQQNRSPRVGIWGQKLNSWLFYVFDLTRALYLHPLSLTHSTQDLDETYLSPPCW